MLLKSCAEFKWSWPRNLNKYSRSCLLLLSACKRRCWCAHTFSNQPPNLLACLQFQNGHGKMQHPFTCVHIFQWIENSKYVHFNPYIKSPVQYSWCTFSSFTGELKNERTIYVVNTTFLVNHENSCAHTMFCFLNFRTIFYEKVQKRMQF